MCEKRERGRVELGGTAAAPEEGDNGEVVPSLFEDTTGTA